MRNTPIRPGFRATTAVLLTLRPPIPRRPVPSVFFFREGGHAFRWKDGVMTDLRLGGIYSQALGTNSSGRIVGELAPVDIEGFDDDPSRSFVWYRGDTTTFIARYRNRAEDISPSGVVVGTADMMLADITPRSDAFVFEQGDRTDLPELGDPGTGLAGAHAISPTGNAVGFSQTPSGETHAVLWTPR